MNDLATAATAAPEEDIIDPRARAAAERYLAAARALGDRSYWPIKMFTGVNLFLWHLDAFAGGDDPVPLFVDAFDQATALLLAAGASGVSGGHFPADAPEPADAERIEAMVSGMFSDVWVGMSDAVYFDESHGFVRDRLERNGVDAQALFEGKTVLDAGCGSGKFSAAIARLGAAKVIGIDIGEKGIAFAREQARKVDYGGRMEFRHGSAHHIPLPDGAVDMVWSNGVIHLTSDYERCLAEFARVIRPGGTLFLYVNGRFGLYELLLDTLRLGSEGIPAPLFQHTLFELGINSGRVYWMMCAYYGPYQWKARSEVEALLGKHGFTDLRQLTRGIEIDQIEQVTRDIPYARAKYGEAQLKYLARRS